VSAVIRTLPAHIGNISANVSAILTVFREEVEAIKI
jgi:hypothetical protein